MLFDRPLASFTNNIIYIDCPTNCKTRLEVVCTIFWFLKMFSFHTPHNNFKTLPLPSKLQREKWKEKLSQILDPLLFSDVFSCCFSFAILGRKTEQNRTCATKSLPFCFPLLHSRRYCINAVTCSQELSAISSRSYLNCWACFVVKLEALYRVGFDVIRKGCRLGEFVLMLSYFGCWI